MQTGARVIAKVLGKVLAAAAAIGAALADPATGLAATVEDDGSVTLDWTDPVSAFDEIAIERQTLNDDDTAADAFTEVGRVAPAVESFNSPAAFAAPDIFTDDLIGVTIDAPSGEFRRAGVGMGLLTAYTSLVPTYINVIADPTDASRRAVMFDYAGMLDANFNLSAPPVAALSDEWFVRGYFYFTHADWSEHGGKLEQLLGSGSGGIQSVFYYQGVAPPASTTDVGLQVVLNDGSVLYEQALGASIAAGRWYRYERRIKINSAYGVADGRITIWLDGVELVDLTAVAWYKANNGKTLKRDFSLGTQYNGVAPASRSRYWRDIAVSTMRVGP